MIIFAPSKTFERLKDVAETSGIFLCPHREIQTSVTAWGSGNTPKAIAQMCLTARSADFFIYLSNTFEL